MFVSIIFGEPFQSGGMDAIGDDAGRGFHDLSEIGVE
jgi:hypothetical protein